MTILTKTSRASTWHIKDDIIDETLCGRVLTSYWETKNFPEASMPRNNMCKKCLKNVDTPALADVTHIHHTW
jgi:hypothetical protein